jgi:hypothetical protein
VEQLGEMLPVVCEHRLPRSGHQTDARRGS